MKKQKEIIFSEGQPIKTTQDIVDFLMYMSKKHNIKQEPRIIEMIVDHYEKSPKGKDHIVMNNDGDLWYSSFLSDSDVLKKIVLD